jgi:hypothetical protein
MRRVPGGGTSLAFIHRWMGAAEARNHWAHLVSPLRGQQGGATPMARLCAAATHTQGVLITRPMYVVSRAICPS